MGDPVQPGAQARPPLETVDGSKGIEKGFLGDILGFGLVAQHVEGQAIDGGRMQLNTLGTSSLIACPDPLRQLLFCTVFHYAQCTAPVR